MYEEIEQSDKTVLLYITTSDLEGSLQDWSMLDNMFLQKLREFDGGYIETYAFDCAWADSIEQPLDFRREETQNSILTPAGETKFSTTCSNEPFQPMFYLVVPPDVRVNPYTGQPMDRNVVPYIHPDGHITEN